MRLAKTDDNQFVRDLQSNALLNTDRGALEQYRRQREMNSRTVQLQREVTSLQTQVAKLTALTEALLARLT